MFMLASFSTINLNDFAIFICFFRINGVLLRLRSHAPMVESTDIPDMFTGLRWYVCVCVFWTNDRITYNCISTLP